MPLPLEMIEVPVSRQQETLRHAVVQGLLSEPKHIPSRFFYDEVGSLLFEQICELKEYYPTRTERRLLSTYADDILQAVGQQRLEIVELGSGNSCKTRLLLEAALTRQTNVHYVPVDISGVFLRTTAESLLCDYPGLRITAIAAEYSDALQTLPTPDVPRLFLFLGSNIGNFESDEAVSFLREIRRQMRPTDRLLLGADQAKDVKILTAAYNDAEGVTAAFNKNLLYRINKELGADFNPENWIHAAPFIAERSRIEMWLMSIADQTVTINGNSYTFAVGDGIHTENSHKYTPASMDALCHKADLSVQKTWTDPNRWFCLHLICPLGKGLDNAR